MDIDFEGGKGVAVVCRWNPHIFGACENTSKDIGDHWFILEVLDKEDYNKMDERLNFYKSNCSIPVSLQLVDYFYLPGNEMVGIIKTFWLKLIQRKWKKIYAARNNP